jgi:hypothetical protein
MDASGHRHAPRGHALPSLRRTLAPLLLAGVLAPLALVRPAAADESEADRLFRQGRAAADRGDYAVACDKFRASQELDPAAGTLLNLADCEQHRGRLATALRLFHDALQKLPARDDRARIARERASALEKRAPRLTVRLAADAPSDAVVRLDGERLEAARLGSPGPVDVGGHLLAVESPGRAARSYTIALAEGETYELEVRPGEAGGGAAGGSSSMLTTTGYVVGGVGIAGLVVGIVTGVMAIDRKSTADAHCPFKSCDSVGWDAVQSGRTLGGVSVASFVVGAAGVAVGTALVVVGRSSSSKAAVGVSAGPGGGSLVLRGAF